MKRDNLLILHSEKKRPFTMSKVELLELLMDMEMRLRVMEDVVFGIYSKK